jgi:hypothetical protein
MLACVGCQSSMPATEVHSQLHHHWSHMSTCECSACLFRLRFLTICSLKDWKQLDLFEREAQILKNLDYKCVAWPCTLCTPWIGGTSAESTRMP